MSDVFRKEYKPLSDLYISQISLIKDTAEELLRLIESFPKVDGAIRYQALAKTALEESIMWAVKAHT
jgi:hypothetical protein